MMKPDPRTSLISAFIYFQLTVYFISGLGADRRIFQHLELPPHLAVKHIEWIEPFPDESLAAYCKRLGRQVDAKEDFILVGLSFGGIVAVEINRIHRARLVVLISSVATRDELPRVFRWINAIKLHRWMPGAFYKWHNPFINWYFGARSVEEKELLRLFLKSSTTNYLKWSIDKILSWENRERPQNLFHIHGTADRIFPAGNTRADLLVREGTHLMVFNHSRPVNKALAEKINALTT
jgi:pimeloyl-ACP methyl ester carboxylesterase